MRRIFLLWMFASSWNAHAQEPMDLVRQTAQHYRELSRYELRGTLTADFVASTWQLVIDAGVVGMGGAAKSGADRAPDLVLYNGIRFVDLQPARGTVAPEIPIGMPPLGFFSKMDKDALSVRRLGDEVVTTGGKEIVCWHLSVLYDDRPDDPIPKNVKYWIDPAEYIVLRERFLGRSGSGGGDSALDVYRNERKLGDGAPEPPALPPAGPEFVEKTELIGNVGPDFRLRELSGTVIDLKAMRGHAVLLDFWSVTCGPCVREMPAVERLAGEYAAKGLELWGVSKDDAETDRRWLRKKGYGLRTLTDSDGAMSTLYKVEGIPVMVLIGRDGKIVQSWLGTPPESDLQGAIDAALR